MNIFAFKCFKYRKWACQSNDAGKETSMDVSNDLSKALTNGLQLVDSFAASRSINRFDRVEGRIHSSIGIRK